MGLLEFKPKYLTITPQTLTNMFKNPEKTIYKLLKININKIPEKYKKYKDPKFLALKLRVKIVNIVNKNGFFFYDIVVYLDKLQLPPV